MGVDEGTIPVTAQYRTPQGGTIAFTKDWNNFMVSGLWISPRPTKYSVNQPTLKSLSGSNTWAKYPSLEQSFDLKRETVVLMWYTLTMPVTSGSSHLVSKLLIDGEEDQASRAISGNRLYMGNYAMMAKKLNIGNHDVSVNYRTPFNGFSTSSENSDWEAQNLNLVELPQDTRIWSARMKSANQRNDDNKWTTVPDLRIEFEIKDKCTLVAMYTLTTFNGDKTIYARLFMNGQPMPGTASTAAETTYSTLGGFKTRKIRKGKHAIEVQYRSNIKGTMEPRNDWQGYSLDLLCIPK